MPKSIDRSQILYFYFFIFICLNAVHSCIGLYLYRSVGCCKYYLNRLIIFNDSRQWLREFSQKNTKLHLQLQRNARSGQLLQSLQRSPLDHRYLYFHSGQPVAIKIVQLNSLKSKKLEELLFSEIDILKKLNHPNVLRCHQVFTSNRNCYIVTELCSQGDLETKLKQKRTLK